MGNSASSPSPSSGDVPPLPPVMEPSLSEKQSDPVPAIPSPDTTTSSDKMLGGIEILHNNVKDLFPVPFEGAKLVINKGLSQYFQVNHNLTLSNIEQAGYRFGVTYVGTKKYSETEVFPLMLGELHPSGNLNAQIIHQPLEFWRFKYIAQIQSSKMVGQQLSNEFRGKSWFAGFTIANPDPFAGRFTGLADLMYRINSRLSLGTMILHQRAPQIPAGSDSILTLGCKLYSETPDKWQAALSLNPHPAQLSLHSSFSIKVNKNIQIGAELETDVMQGASVATVGYQYDLEKANVVFKAQMDSNWNIASSLEKKLLPYPFTFALCGAANQTKSKYSFGVGLIVG